MNVLSNVEPYASPITIPARNAKVISQAHFHPARPLVDGRPLVQPVALDIPPDGPGSVQTDLVEIGWAVHARLHMASRGTPRWPGPSWCCPKHATAPA